MKPDKRRILDLKLFIASLDTMLAHSEWLNAAGMILMVWKMSDEHGGEWSSVKELMIVYVIKWLEETKTDIQGHQFFDRMILEGINIHKTFNIPKKIKKSKVIIDEPTPLMSPYLDMPLEILGDTNEDLP